MKNTLFSLFIILSCFTVTALRAQAAMPAPPVPADSLEEVTDTTEDKDFYKWNEMCESDSEKVAQSDSTEEYWDDFDNDNKQPKKEKHSKWDWDWNWANDFRSTVAIFDWNYSREAISLNYSGETKFNLYNGQSSMAKPGNFEVKIGSTFFKVLKRHGEVIAKYKYNYLQGGLYKQSYGKKIYSGMYETETMRIFAGYEDGYGYKFGPSGLALYSGLGLGYTRVKFQDIKVPEEMKIFNDGYKFSTKTEAGAKLMLIPNLSLDAGIERTTLHPRVLFWKAAGSYILEGASLGLVDDFVDAVFKSTPSVAPVLNFILKNAVSYGWTELRKEKVTFPFDSPAPMMIDQFKLGVTFMF